MSNCDQSVRWLDSVIGIAEQKLHYDTAGRVIKTPTGTLSYDENGRLQQKTEDKDGFRPQQTRYHWDVYDRLIGVTLPDGERWHYRYDPFGRRVEKHRQDSGKDSDENHVYRWDGDNLIAHEIKLGKSERKTEWIYEPDSFRPLAQINQQGENGTPRLSYIITDHAGTVSELCDESGTVLWQGKQALWGEFSEKTDNNITCDLRYQGQIADKETGLYYNRHRYYDSDSRQYLSSDPIGQAKGRYVFEIFPATRGSLAVKSEWNKMTNFTQFKINHGTTIIEGKAAAQGIGLPGGQVQKYIPNFIAVPLKSL